MEARQKRNDPAGKERAEIEAVTSEHEALTEGIELAVSRFRPHLPGEINAAAVERWLLDGPVVFFRDAQLGKFVVQPFKALTDELDVYGVPITRETWNGYNSYTALLNDENSVIIHDNLTDEPLILKLEYYAKMLGKIDEILKQNVRKQRTPTFINADRDNLLSALNVSDLTDCGVDWIYQRNADYEKDLTAVTPMAPFVADRLALLAAEIRARRDALLAVDDISSPKKSD